MGIKQLLNHWVQDFAIPFQVQNLFGTFKKRAPEPDGSKGTHP